VAAGQVVNPQAHQPAFQDGQFIFLQHSRRPASELLGRPHPAQMCADGDREALRLLMTDRDNAV
jgi:hypothetical protein